MYFAQRRICRGAVSRNLERRWGQLVHKGKAAIVEGDAFEDGKRLGSGLNSKKGTPSGSKSATPLPSATNSDNENGSPGDPSMPVVKKKKLTRKQLKDREERRRMRKLRWLSDSTGAPREPDTDTGALKT